MDLEVVWAAYDGTVGVFFACEVPLTQVSICTGQKEDQRTDFARPSFQASMGVAMFEAWALVVGCCMLGVDTESWMSGIE